MLGTGAIGFTLVRSFTLCLCGLTCPFADVSSTMLKSAKLTRSALGRPLSHVPSAAASRTLTCIYGQGSFQHRMHRRRGYDTGDETGR
jgi:hypothetical protein